MNQSDEIAVHQIQVYNQAVNEFGVNSKAVLWDDPQTQYLRFSELIKPIDFNNGDKSILDVGCGNAELYKFINFMGFRGCYVGYDINDKLLEQARSRFPDVDVSNVNIINEAVEKKFNYVLLSGMFNVNVGQTQEWVFEFLSKMFELCNDAMVFNLISTHVTYRDDNMFYMNPAEVFSFCIENLSKRTSVAHHSLPFNYTVTVFKDENWTSVNEVTGDGNEL